MKILDRFEAKFTKVDGCWEWNRYKGRYGYGRFQIDGTSKRAHRVSWELYVGKIPDGLHVLHNCDNPPCVNPSHLFLGTNADNVDDREKKGRSNIGVYRGMKHGRSKLNDSQVLEIREIYSKGKTSQVKLGRLFGVSNSHIYRIVRRKNWNHI